METCEAENLVLVVDDDGDIRDSIEDILELDGYCVVGVENGEQALGSMAVATPDLVMTDLSMPIRDGLALIARMRADERTRGIPVFVISAEAEQAPEGVRVIKKPFEVQELRETVRGALERRGTDENGAGESG